MAQAPTKALSLASASAFLKENGFGPKTEGLEVAEEADQLLRRAKKWETLEVLRAEGLLEKFISECWPNGATAAGKRKIDWYHRGYLRWVKRGGVPPDVEDGEGEDPISDAEEFQILEWELQKYLAKNPGLLEPGMTLWKAADGQSPVEFPVDESGRRIDILGKDKEGVPVVIELKASRGHERVIGQARHS